MTDKQRAIVILSGIIVGYLVASYIVAAIEEGRWQRFRRAYDNEAPEPEHIEHD